LQEAIFEVLGPDLSNEDPARCSWCGRHSDSKHGVVNGVPLCFTCRDRAADAFIRLVKKAQEEQ
jgi:hypothetical protein